MVFIPLFGKGVEGVSGNSFIREGCQRGPVTLFGQDVGGVCNNLFVWAGCQR